MSPLTVHEVKPKRELVQIQCVLTNEPIFCEKVENPYGGCQLAEYKRAISYLQRSETKYSTEFLTESGLDKLKLQIIKLLLQRPNPRQYDDLIYGFIVAKSDALSDDRYLWSAFADISLRLDFTFDVKIATAYAHAYALQWELVEQALLGVVGGTTRFKE